MLPKQFSSKRVISCVTVITMLALLMSGCSYSVRKSTADTIFIGAPVWWGDWPMICYTFFENNADALAGKTLIPFSTHEGSGLSGFDRKLSSALPDSSVGEGLAITGSDAQNNREKVNQSVNEWLTELGY